MEFEWERAKAVANHAKHAVRFEDAAAILEQGSVVLERSDRKGEVRWTAIGMLGKAVVTVVFTERETRTRIISARTARRNERERYRACFGS